MTNLELKALWRAEDTAQYIRDTDVQIEDLCARRDAIQEQINALKASQLDVQGRAPNGQA